MIVDPSMDTFWQQYNFFVSSKRNPDIGPDSSFAYVNSSYDVVTHLEALTECLSQVELSTNCKTSVHGQWVKIKGPSSSARRQAFSIINSFTANSCKEVISIFLLVLIVTWYHIETSYRPHRNVYAKFSKIRFKKQKMTN